MCGICGYIGNRISDIDLSRMNDIMYHRGPDDSGIWQGEWHKGGSIGLAHRRLSIIDLSELGHQPMISQNGKWIIVFNGEIYNYKELRDELKERGYSFVSKSDTEVVLNSFVEWEDKAARKLNGMFAIAAYNSERKILYLVRDRIGKKPLYYYIQDENIIFASELKSILACPNFENNINLQVLKHYLCKQYVSGTMTFYNNTYKVLPGHQLIIGEDSIIDDTYWNLSNRYEQITPKMDENYDTCKAELKKQIYNAVERRLVSDVPVGTFLSGGIDSTLVTAIANDLCGGIKSFTIGFFDKKRNEADYAKHTAEYLGITHVEHYISERDMIESIKQLNKTFDEPFADPSAIPCLLVSELAKNDVTVVLTGDGGDEFFCGYEMYNYLYYMEKLEPIVKLGSSILKGKLGDSIKHYMPRAAVALLNNTEEQYKVQLFEDLPEEVVNSILISEGGVPVKSELESAINAENYQVRRMLLDMKNYLPENVLAKADRTSMQHSLELRCPLLDTNVMEYSFRIPHRYKYHHNEKKYILKDILYDFVPKEMMNRPKNGFGVPLGKWLRNDLIDEIYSYSGKDFLEKQGLFRYEGVNSLINQVKKSDRRPYPKVLWAYYVFQRWYVENEKG